MRETTGKQLERLSLPGIILLLHAIVVFAVWLLLFVSKWFPYAVLAEVRDWLYRYL
jgi:hypothetical protein